MKCNSTRATAFIFDTGTGVHVKVSKFLRQEGGTNPPTFGFMPNALTIWAIRARHLLSHGFEHWLWRYIYFWTKVNILNVNCARATAFIFETRTGVRVKVSTFLRQKMSRPEGDSNPNLRITHVMLPVSRPSYLHKGNPHTWENCPCYIETGLSWPFPFCRYAALLRDAWVWGKKKSLVSSLGNAIVPLVSYAGLAVAYLYSNYLIMEDQITAGGVVLVCSYFIRCIMPGVLLYTL